MSTKHQPVWWLYDKNKENWIIVLLLSIRDYKSNFCLEAAPVRWFTVRHSNTNAGTAPHFENKMYLLFFFIAFRISHILLPPFSSMLRKHGKNLRSRKDRTYGGRKRRWVCRTENMLRETGDCPISSFSPGLTLQVVQEPLFPSLWRLILCNRPFCVYCWLWWPLGTDDSWALGM